MNPDEDSSDLFLSSPVILKTHEKVSELFNDEVESANEVKVTVNVDPPTITSGMPQTAAPLPVSKKQLWRETLRQREKNFVHSELEETPERWINEPESPDGFDISLDDPDEELVQGDVGVVTRCRIERPVDMRVGPSRGEPKPIGIPNPASMRESPDTALTDPMHVLLIVHGINGSCDNLLGNLEKFKQAVSDVQERWFPGQTPQVHCEMINWKSHVIGIQNSMFEKITPRHMSRESRMFINFAISDVAFYLTPKHCGEIKKVVVKMLNERVKEVKGGKRDVKFSLVGYSLGSVILHDILEEQFNGGDLLEFEIDKFFLWGSPLAAYLSVKDIEYQTGKFTLPKHLDIINIFHPHDPVAFRIEPLYYYLDSETETTESELVPFWENSGLASGKVLADAWSSIVSSIWSDPLDAVDTALVPKRRLDFVLQESVTENISHKYSMLTAHHSYWTSRDVALFMIRRLTQGGN